MARSVIVSAIGTWRWSPIRTRCWSSYQLEPFGQNGAVALPDIPRWASPQLNTRLLVLNSAEVELTCRARTAEAKAHRCRSIFVSCQPTLGPTHPCTVMSVSCHSSSRFPLTRRGTEAIPSSPYEDRSTSRTSTCCISRTPVERGSGRDVATILSIVRGAHATAKGPQTLESNERWN